MLFPRLTAQGLLNCPQGVAKASHGASSRLVRICAEDDAEAGSVARVFTALCLSLTRVMHSGPIRMAPQLLHNITSGSPSPSAHGVSLRPSPFGSGKPAIPTARSVTIARVASPISTDRAYQPLFLRALQDHFKDTTRLVKQGDVVTVAINTDEVLWQTGDGADEAGDGADPTSRYMFVLLVAREGIYIYLFCGQGLRVRPMSSCSSS